MLAAVDALRASGVKPAINFRFVFEGEEEAGSPHLAQYLEKYPQVLRPDAWILCDGPVHQSRRMELFFGARGTIDLELTVYGPVKGLHDGHYGNWVPNPIVRLTHLIDSMRDENGRILIKGFYDDVKPPSAAELAVLKKIPDVESDLRHEFQISATEGDGKHLNETLLLPALNVRGIESGHVGANASNTIQTEARASIDFRLVPNETPESIKPLVERHIEAQGYTIVHETPDAASRAEHPKLVRLEWGSGYPPARTSLDLPLSREIACIMTAAGHEPVRLPTVGGSIPMYLFQQPNDTPVIGLPIANHDDNQHAADENLRLQNLWDGIEIYAALLRGCPRGSLPSGARVPRAGDCVLAITNFYLDARLNRLECPFVGHRAARTRALPWVETAPFQERFDVGIAAGEIVEELHRVLAPAAREEGVAEMIAVFALQAAMLLEPFDAVGIELFAPDVAVITGAVTAGKGVREIGAAITRRNGWQIDARFLERVRFEGQRVVRHFRRV